MRTLGVSSRVHRRGRRRLDHRLSTPDLRRHLPTFARFLRETNTTAYLLVHPLAARPARHRITIDIADDFLE
jgi:hypothetical protein